MTDTKKLRAKMLEAGYSQTRLAGAVGLCVNTINRKINNRRAFTCDEVDEVCRVLHIDDPAEMAQIFLAKKSQ